MSSGLSLVPRPLLFVYVGDGKKGVWWDVLFHRLPDYGSDVSKIERLLMTFLLMLNGFW